MRSLLAPLRPLLSAGTGPVRWRTVAGFAAFAIPFAFVLVMFRVCDVYHERFFAAGSGRTYLAYNAARVLYIAYLAWLVSFVGRVTVGRLERKWGALGLAPLEEFVLTFYVGAAVGSTVLFGMGFLNLYRYWVLMPLSVGLLAVSYPAFVSFWGRAAGVVRAKWVADRNPLRRALRFAALAGVGSLAGLLVVVKALPPNGGGDYYTHYFPYFQHVVASHGLWPNDVWYHYYVSKGATLVFASIVLTDPLAPELVTTCFVLVAGLALYSVVRRYANNSLVPLAAVAAFLCAFVNTRGTGAFAAIEWGQFQKHHEYTASLVASVAWAVVYFRDRPGVWTGTVVTGVLAAGVVLFAPTAFPLVGGLLGVVVASAVVRRQWQAAGRYVIAGSAAAAVLAGLLALNYATTGMAEISPFRPFWRHADQAAFSRWVSPYLMTLLEEGSAAGMGDVQLVNWEGSTRLEFVAQLVRVQAARFLLLDGLVSPVYLVGGFVAGVALLLARGRRTRLDFARAAVPVVGTLAVAVGLSQVANQPVSVYRYFSFTIFFTVAAPILGWVLLFRLAPNRQWVGLTSYILPTVVVGAATYHGFADVPPDEYEHAVKFASGKVSLADAYRRRGAVSEPAVAYRKQIGTAARVYTFNLNDYSMSPGAEVESFVSFGLHQDWHTVMFEPPAAARAALQAQRLDYFVMNFKSRVIDVLQYAPLFRSENLAQNFAVAWTDGDVYLLTWAGPGMTPLPESFFWRYTDEHFAGTIDLKPLYDQVARIYAANRGRPYPVVRDPNLPRVKGWQ